MAFKGNVTQETKSVTLTGGTAGDNLNFAENAFQYEDTDEEGGKVKKNYYDSGAKTSFTNVAKVDTQTVNLVSKVKNLKVNLTNASNLKTLVAESGGYTITDSGDASALESINLKNGNNTFNVTADHSTALKTITMGAGADTLKIKEGGSINAEAEIDLGAGNNEAEIATAKSFKTDKGNDKLTVTGTLTTADLGKGNDVLTVSGTVSDANLGEGNDTVVVSATGEVVATGGKGNDIYKVAAGGTLTIADWSDNKNGTPKEGVDQIIVDEGTSITTHQYTTADGGTLTLTLTTPAAEEGETDQTSSITIKSVNDKKINIITDKKKTVLLDQYYGFSSGTYAATDNNTGTDLTLESGDGVSTVSAAAHKKALNLSFYNAGSYTAAVGTGAPTDNRYQATLGAGNDTITVTQADSAAEVVLTTGKGKDIININAGNAIYLTDFDFANDTINAITGFELQPDLTTGNYYTVLDSSDAIKGDVDAEKDLILQFTGKVGTAPADGEEDTRTSKTAVVVIKNGLWDGVKAKQYINIAQTMKSKSATAISSPHTIVVADFNKNNEIDFSNLEGSITLGTSSGKESATGKAKQLTYDYEDDTKNADADYKVTKVDYTNAKNAATIVAGNVNVVATKKNDTIKGADSALLDPTRTAVTVEDNKLTLTVDGNESEVELEMITKNGSVTKATYTTNESATFYWGEATETTAIVDDEEVTTKTWTATVTLDGTEYTLTKTQVGDGDATIKVTGDKLNAKGVELDGSFTDNGTEFTLNDTTFTYIKERDAVSDGYVIFDETSVTNSPATDKRATVAVSFSVEDGNAKVTTKEGAVTAYTAIDNSTATVDGGAGNDIFIGNGAGGNFSGGAGNDVFRTGATSDENYYASGDMVVAGGAGKDSFILAGSGTMEITDFTAADDSIIFANESANPNLKTTPLATRVSIKDSNLENDKLSVTFGGDVYFSNDKADSVDGNGYYSSEGDEVEGTLTIDNVSSIVAAGKDLNITYKGIKFTQKLSTTADAVTATKGGVLAAFAPNATNLKAGSAAAYLDATGSQATSIVLEGGGKNDTLIGNGSAELKGSKGKDWLVASDGDKITGYEKTNLVIVDGLKELEITAATTSDKTNLTVTDDDDAFTIEDVDTTEITFAENTTTHTAASSGKVTEKVTQQTMTRSFSTANESLKAGSSTIFKVFDNAVDDGVTVVESGAKTTYLDIEGKNVVSIKGGKSGEEYVINRAANSDNTYNTNAVTITSGAGNDTFTAEDKSDPDEHFDDIIVTDFAAAKVETRANAAKNIAVGDYKSGDILNIYDILESGDTASNLKDYFNGKEGATDYSSKITFSGQDVKIGNVTLANAKQASIAVAYYDYGKDKYVTDVIQLTDPTEYYWDATKSKDYAKAKQEVKPGDVAEKVDTTLNKKGVILQLGKNVGEVLTGKGVDTIWTNEDGFNENNANTVVNIDSGDGADLIVISAFKDEITEEQTYTTANQITKGATVKIDNVDYTAKEVTQDGDKYTVTYDYTYSPNAENITYAIANGTQDKIVLDDVTIDKAEFISHVTKWAKDGETADSDSSKWKDSAQGDYVIPVAWDDPDYEAVTAKNGKTTTYYGEIKLYLTDGRTVDIKKIASTTANDYSLAVFKANIQEGTDAKSATLQLLAYGQGNIEITSKDGTTIDLSGAGLWTDNDNDNKVDTFSALNVSIESKNTKATTFTNAPKGSTVGDSDNKKAALTFKGNTATDYYAVSPELYHFTASDKADDNVTGFSSEYSAEVEAKAVDKTFAFKADGTVFTVTLGDDMKVSAIAVDGESDNLKSYSKKSGENYTFVAGNGDLLTFTTASTAVADGELDADKLAEVITGAELVTADTDAAGVNTPITIDSDNNSVLKEAVTYSTAYINFKINSSDEKALKLELVDGTIDYDKFNSTYTTVQFVESYEVNETEAIKDGNKFLAVLEDGKNTYTTKATLYALTLGENSSKQPAITNVVKANYETARAEIKTAIAQKNDSATYVGGAKNDKYIGNGASDTVDFSAGGNNTLEGALGRQQSADSAENGGTENDDSAVLTAIFGAGSESVILKGGDNVLIKNYSNSGKNVDKLLLDTSFQADLVKAEYADATGTVESGKSAKNLELTFKDTNGDVATVVLENYAIFDSSSKTLESAPEVYIAQMSEVKSGSKTKIVTTVKQQEAFKVDSSTAEGINILTGGSTNDYLDASGAATVDGGKGNDTIYAAYGEGNLVVQNYSTGKNVIDLGDDSKSTFVLEDYGTNYIYDGGTSVTLKGTYSTGDDETATRNIILEGVAKKESGNAKTSAILFNGKANGVTYKTNKNELNTGIQLSNNVDITAAKNTAVTVVKDMAYWTKSYNAKAATKGVEVYAGAGLATFTGSAAADTLYTSEEPGAAQIAYTSNNSKANINDTIYINTKDTAVTYKEDGTTVDKSNQAAITFGDAEIKEVKAEYGSNSVKVKVGSDKGYITIVDNTEGGQLFTYKRTVDTKNHTYTETVYSTIFGTQTLVEEKEYDPEGEDTPTPDTAGTTSYGKDGYFRVPIVLSADTYTTKSNGADVTSSVTLNNAVIADRTLYAIVKNRENEYTVDSVQYETTYYVDADGNANDEGALAKTSWTTLSSADTVGAYSNIELSIKDNNTLIANYQYDCNTTSKVHDISFANLANTITGGSAAVTSSDKVAAADDDPYDGEGIARAVEITYVGTKKNNVFTKTNSGETITLDSESFESNSDLATYTTATTAAITKSTVATSETLSDTLTVDEDHTAKFTLDGVEYTFTFGTTSTSGGVYNTVTGINYNDNKSSITVDENKFELTANKSGGDIATAFEVKYNEGTYTLEHKTQTYTGSFSLPTTNVANTAAYTVNYGTDAFGNTRAMKKDNISTVTLAQANTGYAISKLSNDDDKLTFTISASTAAGNYQVYDKTTFELTGTTSENNQVSWTPQREAYTLTLGTDNTADGDKAIALNITFDHDAFGNCGKINSIVAADNTYATVAQVNDDSWSTITVTPTYSSVPTTVTIKNADKLNSTSFTASYKPTVYQKTFTLPNDDKYVITYKTDALGNSLDGMYNTGIVSIDKLYKGEVDDSTGVKLTNSTFTVDAEENRYFKTTITLDDLKTFTTASYAKWNATQKEETFGIGDKENSLATYTTFSFVFGKDAFGNDTKEVLGFSYTTAGGTGSLKRNVSADDEETELDSFQYTAPDAANPDAERTLSYTATTYKTDGSASKVGSITWTMSNFNAAKIGTESNVKGGSFTDDAGNTYLITFKSDALGNAILSDDGISSVTVAQAVTGGKGTFGKVETYTTQYTFQANPKDTANTNGYNAIVNVAIENEEGENDETVKVVKGKVEVFKEYVTDTENSDKGAVTPANFGTKAYSADDVKWQNEAKSAAYAERGFAETEALFNDFVTSSSLDSIVSKDYNAAAITTDLTTDFTKSTKVVDVASYLTSNKKK